MSTPLFTDRRRFIHAHRRRLTIAVLFSIAVHGMFLLGFNTKAAAKKADGLADKTTAMEVFFAPAEEPPPPTAQSTLKSTERAADEATSSAASLPEPISTTVINDISTVLTPSAPVPPRFEGNIWVIPPSQIRARGSQLAESRVFDLNELDRKPELIAQMPPVYPLELRRKNIAGVVNVNFVVTARGEVIQAEIVSSPDPLLSAAVLKALEIWRFRAGVKNGRNVPANMEIPIRFQVE